MERHENDVQIIVRRAAQFGTHSGYGLYSEYVSTEEVRPLSKSLTDLTGIERQGSQILMYSSSRRKYGSRIVRTSEPVARRAGMSYLNPNRFPKMQSPWTESTIAKEAGRRVTHLFMLHAWRNRRLDTKRSQTVISALHIQVESLNMQVYVLKQLLENEKTRRDLAVKKMHTEKVENERERNLILKEKETFECKVKELLEINAESENQKNNFKAAKLEANYWEMHYRKEKENSETWKDRYLVQEKKTKKREEMLLHQTQSMRELEKRNTAVEEELQKNLTLLNDSVEQLNSVQEKLKLSEELRKQQDWRIMEKNEEINHLRAQIALMEEKLQEQDERNGELGKLISDKTKELVLLSDKLGELTKEQRFWGNRVLQMAAICTRIPIACIYTVATLLLPQPSYRPI